MGNRFALLRAQLLRTGEPALLTPEFSQGHSGRVLLMAGLIGRFFFVARLVRRFIHGGMGELVQVERLGSFA